MRKLALIVMILACTNAFAIRNAKKITHRSLPNMVKIMKKAGVCSGIRISHNYVLTAAHCFHKQTRGTFSIKYMQDGILIKKTIKISTVVFKGYNLSEELAIFPINPKIDASESKTEYHKIFPYKKDSFLVNQELEVAGFGMGKKGSAGTLKRGKVLFKQDLKNAARYTYNMMLVKPGKSNQMLCPGDSGGPLFKKDKNGKLSLVGIISFIASTKYNLKNYDANKQCALADVGSYIPLNFHMNFISTYL